MNILIIEQIKKEDIELVWIGLMHVLDIQCPDHFESKVKLNKIYDSLLCVFFVSRFVSILINIK